MADNTLFSALFAHYVINGEPLAGVISPTRTNKVVPLHRTTQGELGPLGLIAGSAYDPALENLSNSMAISSARSKAGGDHILERIGTYDLEKAIEFHDNLVQNVISYPILRGRNASARGEWLFYILQNSRSDGRIARSPACRKIARVALRGSNR